MLCPHCNRDGPDEAQFCGQCGANLALAVIEVNREDILGETYFVKPRPFTIGRALENDLTLSDPSVSRQHARITYERGRFFIEDLASRAGVTVDGARIQRAPLGPGSTIRLGDAFLKFTLLPQGSPGGATARGDESQLLLLSLLETINSTRVLSEVTEKVLDAVMRITGAERGFVLLADEGDSPALAGMRVAAARTNNAETAPAEPQGLSTSVLKRVRETGQMVATGNAMAEPTLDRAQSVIALSLRTIVCIPLTALGADGSARLLGLLYMDNHKLSAPFSSESLKAAEALARHAALAIATARFIEQEESTIQDLARARDQALEASRAKGAFLSNMSHELHTPLNAIIGYAEILEEQARELGHPSYLEDLRRIREAGRRLLGLIDDVLDVSRLEDGRMELHVQEVPLAPVLEQLAARGKALAQEKGLAFVLHASESVHAVRADPERLRQTLMNLLANAAKFTDTGTVSLDVRRETTDAGAWVAFDVADTGIGMTAEQIRGLFQPFAQVDASSTRRFGGAGLGLAIAQRLCERMGGELSVESEPGRGSRFTIRLPAA